MSEIRLTIQCNIIHNEIKKISEFAIVGTHTLFTM